MKFLPIFLYLTLSYSLFASSSQIEKINFNFDFYLSNPFYDYNSLEEVKEKWEKEILDEARILASARVYGYQFSYFSSQTFGKKTKPIFKLTPLALIPYGSPQLQIKDIKEIKTNHFQVEVSYFLTNYEKIIYNNYKKLFHILPPSKGEEKWESNQFFFSEALSNSIFNAIHTYAQEKKIEILEGDVLLIKTNPILIKGNFAIQYSQVQIRH